MYFSFICRTPLTKVGIKEKVTFNRKVDGYIHREKHTTPSIPLFVFNTYNMTSGTTSFDGTHFGLGINVMKSKILFNFIEQLTLAGLF